MSGTENPERRELSDRLETERLDGEVTLVLKGQWTTDSKIEPFEPVETMLRQDVTAVSFDVADLERWDSSLVLFLYRVVQTTRDIDATTDTRGLPKSAVKLLELATAVPEQDTRGSFKRKGFLTRFGEQVIALISGCGSGLAFIGQALTSLVRLASGRSSMRWREFWIIVQRTGPAALPIVGLISFLVGLIVAFLGVVVLQEFGAGIYSAHLVGFGILRELGAVMAAIIMVGRTGAAFAAEIGTMKVTEELDALETMGVNPMDYVVLPRLLALLVMMPLLTLYADLIGIAGGILVSVSMLDISPQLLLGTMWQVVELWDFLIGILKGFVFGGLIGVAGCIKGLQCGTSADSVGRATTSAVVLGITLIVAANSLIDWLDAIT